MKEKERAEQWITSPRTRQEYIEEFSRYKKMYDEIFEQLPFYVRTNMILVDAVDVKKKYTTSLDETVSFLQKAIHNDVHSNNTRLAKEIVSM